MDLILSVLGMSRVASAAKRWRRAYKTQGALGLDDARTKYQDDRFSVS